MVKKDRRKEVGRAGENVATQLLIQKGYQILTRNWSTRLGELDIIARHHQTIIFVEVRTTRSSRFGLGVQSVGARKQQQVRQLALQYLQQHAEGKCAIRFDVISILMGADLTPMRIDHYEGAF